jgi:hypothetical protein
MLSRWRGSFGKWRYDRSCRRVVNLPALSQHEAPLSIVSMVSHRDLIMYLVAIRSFYTRIGEGSIIIIDDGSLTREDVELLHRCLGRPQIVAVDEVGTCPCPRGGTWERLLYILDLSAQHYVIQLDSDTLTLDAVDEVIDAYRSNRAFTLSTRMGSTIVSLHQASSNARQFKGQHVQVIAEQSFQKIDNSPGLRYVRGCSAFAGFAKGAFTRAQAECFSLVMMNEIGSKWKEWGSEQVTSNIAIASSPNPLLLPYPRYATYHPGLATESSIFLHFIGTHRFRSNVYRSQSSHVVARLEHLT